MRADRALNSTECRLGHIDARLGTCSAVASEVSSTIRHALPLCYPPRQAVEAGLKEYVMSESEKRTRGVVDLVFLLDVTGSMQPCIEAVKQSIGRFVEDMTQADANNDSPIKDWRIKVCGYRDYKSSAVNWLVNKPFVKTVPEVLSQISSEDMQAAGGGDEPESVLDALMVLARTEQSGVQDSESPDKWRMRGTATRVVVFFTDATFNTPTSAPEAAPGATVEDVVSALMGARIVICGFVPEWQGYLELAATDRAEVNFVAKLADAPALAGLGQPGEPGRAAMNAAVSALSNTVSDTSSFKKVMAQLAKTVSKSAAVELA